MTARRSCYEIGAEIVATLLHGPRTWPEVEEQAGLVGSKDTSAHWLEQLRASGVLRVCGYRRSEHAAKVGRLARVYELQAPFAREDEPAGWKGAR